MCRFLDLYNDKILATDYPVNAQAAWLHHRFARTHPSQDGNGRISRLLMAWAYAKGGLPPPVVSTEGKIEYILARNLRPKQSNWHDTHPIVSFVGIAGRRDHNQLCGSAHPLCIDAIQQFQKILRTSIYSSASTKLDFYRHPITHKCFDDRVNLKIRFVTIVANLGIMV